MKQYPGYTLVKREECPEQHGTLTVSYTHLTLPTKLEV